MSEYLPYEQQLQQQLNDLPLPDENLAWADMKRRLEKDDDDGAIVWWRRGCFLWGLLLLVLIGGGWFLLKPQRWLNKKAEVTQVKERKNERDQKQIREDSSINDSNEKSEQEKKNNKPEKQLLIDSSVLIPGKKDQFKINKAEEKLQPGKIKRPAISVKKTNPDKPNKTNAIPSRTRTNKNTTLVKPDKDPLISKDISADSSQSIAIPEPIKKIDSIQKANRDSTRLAKQTDALKKIEEEKKKEDKNKIIRPILFSAGIGLHQQLPIAGQKLTPYNSLGRKGSLADYIPSIYIKMEKEKKWFLQFEIRYGAPQYTKEFTYRQEADTGLVQGFTLYNSSNLKKTYYHQLPLSFNYYVLPNWSVGAGLQLNKFYGLVSEKVKSVKNNLTQQDSVFSKVIITETIDSAIEFKKSYLLGVTETQYQWKRFLIGVKYTFGLQSYIQFQLPGQSPRQERSHAVQVFLRYQLWKAKEKKK